MLDARPNLEQEPKNEYESDLEYFLRKTFGGKSSGRRLKRVIAKFGLCQLLCGIGLLTISICENELFGGESHFANSTYGAPLMSLMFLVSIPTLLLGIVSMVVLRYWTSLTTNRQLLVTLSRGYAITCFPIFVFLLWTTCVLFLTFQDVKWKSDALLLVILPYYSFTVVFILAALISFLYYMLDLSYLADEAQRRDSIIGEPINIVAHDDTHRDLSHMDPSAALGALCAGWTLCCTRCYTLTGVLASHGYEAVENRRKRDDDAPPAWWHGLWRRLFSCLSWGSRKTGKVQPSPAEDKDDERRRSSLHQLHALTKNVENDLEEGSPDGRRAVKSKQRRDEEDAAILAAEKEKHAARQQPVQEEPEDDARVLSTSRYKALWSSLEAAGSFQCKLREAVATVVFTEHLQSQGFHVVFTSSPSPADLEVGICNLRKSSAEPWFIARFLISRNSLSAVLKTEDKTKLKAFVKNFALSKILKIDTSDMALL